jgi:uridine kinase
MIYWQQIHFCKTLKENHGEDFKINIREYRMGNKKWTIQKDWQHRVHRVKKTTTQYVLDNTKQTNTNNINKTLALLQTTWG